MFGDDLVVPVEVVVVGKENGCRLDPVDGERYAVLVCHIGQSTWHPPDHPVTPGCCPQSEASIRIPTPLLLCAFGQQLVTPLLLRATVAQEFPIICASLKVRSGFDKKIVVAGFAEPN
jgi:hypothetical protein